MKIVALAGGVGGAKFIDGLAGLLSPDELSVIVNTGDDFEHWGLKICPDLDTVCYTLAGLANPVTGWGRRDETWLVFQAVKRLGGSDWFQLGDKDLATHIFRTEHLAQGVNLTDITGLICRRLGVEYSVFPMSNNSVKTIVHTRDHGALGFQHYFVKERFQPVVQSFELRGAAQARPVPEAILALKQADLVIIAPSNPWVSIDPILAIPGYLEVLKTKPVIALSPLVAGKALKGPAAKMYRELGYEPSASTVVTHYKNFLTGFVLDNQDQMELEKIEGWLIITLLTDIIMKDESDRIRLAKEVLEFGYQALNRSN